MATRLEFVKMHGCGNDYIYINAFDREIENPEKLALVLSRRRFGIGSDGLVLICKSGIADAKMRMFNGDGSEGKMCGNAIRCVAKYLYDSGICKKDEMRIETLSGVKTLRIFTEKGLAVSVRVDMGKAELHPAKIPVLLPGDRIIDAPLIVEDKTYRITCVSMGNPHAVVFCGDPDQLDLEKIGPCFEHHEIFPERVNTEFVKVLDKNTIKLRVWERGSGETLACGTGSCAAVVASVLNGYCSKGQDIRVILRGGELTINYTDDRVQMTGDCVKVFEGVVEI